MAGEGGVSICVSTACSVNTANLSQWKIAQDFEVLYLEHFIYFQGLTTLKMTESRPWFPVDPTSVILNVLKDW